MPKWQQWINDENEEINDEYEVVQKIRKKNKPVEFQTTNHKKESPKHQKIEKEDF